MRNLATGLTMRKDGVLPRGSWFKIENKTDDEPVVYIYDEIGFWGTEASEFVKELQNIDSKSFQLHINSPGGEVFDGIAIYNAIKQHSAEVTVYVDGLAASAASFIAQAGDKVVMARNAQMMIHDGIAVAYGNAADLRDTADLLDKVSNNIADMYAFAAKNRGFETTLEDFRALMQEEVWYTGAEAVDAGLADEVLDQDNEEAETAKNKWDLTFYNHAGREKADSPSRVTARLLVSDHAKENEMGGIKPRIKNQGEETPPEAPAKEDDEGTEGTEGDEGTEGEGTPTPPPAPKAPQAPEAPANTTGVIINGQLETDWNKIQAHLKALETAQVETTNANRREFVENLSSDNKIPAPQVDSLVALALTMTAEQYAAFQASYESAPASSLFGSYGDDKSGRSSSAPSSSDVKNKEQRIKDLQGIIDQLERSSMSEEKIKKTATYQELEQLLGNES